MTFCTHSRQCLLGQITADEMRLNAAGKMVQQGWEKLPETFPQIDLDAFVVMPNHFHGIIVVGAPLVGAQWNDVQRDDTQLDGAESTMANVGAPLVGAQFDGAQRNDAKRNDARLDGAQSTRATTRVAPTVGNIIGAFKSLTTNAYIKGVKNGDFPEFDGKIWQRNFYERMIRNEKEWEKTACYIQDNPRNWQNDEHYS